VVDCKLLHWAYHPPSELLWMLDDTGTAAYAVFTTNSDNGIYQFLLTFRLLQDDYRRNSAIDLLSMCWAS